MFYVGQKVVCVDAAMTQRSGKIVLQEGTVYTVRWVGKHNKRHPRRPELSNGIGLLLVEVKRQTETPFSSLRFRPAQIRKTDISVFTEMLIKLPSELLTTDQRLT